MTAPRDPDLLIRAFLEEGRSELPDRTYDAVRDQIDHTRQRVVIGPWRESSMSNTTRLAIAAAAVLVVAVIGILLLPGQRDGIGGPGSATSPTPTPVQSAAIRATRSPERPTPFESDTLTLEDIADPGPLDQADFASELESGRHRVAAPFAVPFSIRVSSEWVLRSLAEGEVTFQNFGDGSIGLYLPTNVFADPCKQTPMDPPVARTVDGIIVALDQMAGFTVEDPTDVILDGHPGKSLVLNRATSTSTCPNGTELPLFSYRGSPEGAVTCGLLPERLSVIDVTGTPVIIRRGIDVAACPGSTPYRPYEDDGPLGSLEEVISSIDFDD